MKPSLSFPKKFVWGVAAAAPQIEGAAFEDGKGESNWDRFARQPGRIANGDTLEVACDHYHRYRSDFALMRRLGVKNYRLSIAWPRIFPAGRGTPNPRGIDFYHRLLDAILAAGITPWVTMFHWARGARTWWARRAGRHHRRRAHFRPGDRDRRQHRRGPRRFHRGQCSRARPDLSRPLLGGLRARHRARSREATKGDFDLIALPTDFLGLNIYTGRFVRAGKRGRPEELPLPQNFPEADAGWLKHVPQAMYWGPRLAREVYGARAIYVTENGAGYDDPPPVKGEVLDLHRRDYVRHCLLELHRAVREGVPVRGYFLWSFMDNFEWQDGYTRRFGIVYVDYPTQRRTPKLSAHWYAEVMRRGAIV